MSRIARSDLHIFEKEHLEPLVIEFADNVRHTLQVGQNSNAYDLFAAQQDGIGDDDVNEKANTSLVFVVRHNSPKGDETLHLLNRVRNGMVTAELVADIYRGQPGDDAFGERAAPVLKCLPEFYLHPATAKALGLRAPHYNHWTLNNP